MLAPSSASARRRRRGLLPANFVTHFLWIAGAIVAAMVAAFLYVTAAVNFVANQQDVVDSVPAVGSDPSAFLRTLHGAAGEGFTTGNDVALYQNGDQIFPPMLAAIRESRSTVHFSSYILWSGEIAERFGDAFCDAARRGVVVRLLIDSEGSAHQLRAALVQRLRDAGCHFAWYHAAQWFDLTKYNRRTHRRILVVDGAIAFTGGAGIADLWLGDADSPAHWRDTHARVTGPVVRAFQAGFTDSWNQATRELLLHERDFPRLASRGETTATAVISTPAGGSSPAQRVMAACIAGASRTLRVTNAYFVPTPAFVRALCAARARGVVVTIIVPGPHHNKPFVRRASRHAWPALLASGVAIHEFQPAMVHAKTLTVDGALLLVGSINFDPRSFSLNAECGIVVASQRLVAELDAASDADISRSRRITAAEVAARSLGSRAIDAVCYWLRAEL